MNANFRLVFNFAETVVCVSFGLVAGLLIGGISGKRCPPPAEPVTIVDQSVGPAPLDPNSSPMDMKFPDAGEMEPAEVERAMNASFEAFDRDMCIECLFQRGDEEPMACEARCVRAGSHVRLPTPDGCICMDGQKFTWNWEHCLDQAAPDCEQFGWPPISDRGILDRRIDDK